MVVADVKPELLRVLDALPPFRQAQVLDFAHFLHRQMAEGTPVVEVRQPPRIEVRAFADTPFESERLSKRGYCRAWRFVLYRGQPLGRRGVKCRPIG